jgi:hypothetical protein
MSQHVHVIDVSRHEAFLKQHRKDPVLKELFKHGDRVVICAVCRSAFLEESWKSIEGTHCGQRETLPTIQAEAAPGRFKKPRAADKAAAPPPPRTRSILSALLGKKGATEPDRPTPPPVSMRLREIPIQLRPALRLREVE